MSWTHERYLSQDSLRKRDAPYCKCLRREPQHAGGQLADSTFLVRRAILGDERFDQSLPTAEDRDLWVRLGPRIAASRADAARPPRGYLSTISKAMAGRVSIRVRCLAVLAFPCPNV